MSRPAVAALFVASLFAVALAAVVARAQEPVPVPAAEGPLAKPKPVIGRHVDRYWGFALEVKRLAQADAVGGPEVVYRGNAAGGVGVEVIVVEAAAAKSASVWADERVAAWERDGRALGGLKRSDVSDVPVVAFSTQGPERVVRSHAYAFHIRGGEAAPQLFLVHAARDSGPDAGELAKLAASFDLHAPTGASLCAVAHSKGTGIEPQDPHVVSAAMGAYLSRAVDNPAMAAVTLDGAAEFGDEMRVGVLEAIGVAFLTRRETKDAIRLLECAFETATGAEPQPFDTARIACNLACAYSVHGRVDDAFDTLRRILDTPTWAGLREHAQGDEDLKAMRADARWSDFK